MNNMMASRSRSAPDNRAYEAEKFGAGFIMIAVYYFFEYVRPQDSFIGALAYLKISMILSICLFIYMLKSDKSILRDRLVVLVLLFLAEIAVSVIYAVNTYYVYIAFEGMALMVIVVLAMPIAIQTDKKYTTLVGYWVFINMLVAIHVATHRGRGPGGFTWDENDAALTIVMAIPLALALMYFKGNTKGRKILYMVAALVSVIAVVASMSRGGFLGLASIPFSYWIVSKNKLKNLGKFLLLIALLGYPVYQLTPDRYKAEVESITDKSDDTRNTRLEFWGLAWDMFLDNPAIGVGARNYPWNVAIYQMRRPGFDGNGKLLGGREVHSLYFSLLSELGSVGAIIYVMILFQLVKRLLRIVRLGEMNDSFYNLGVIAKALLVSLSSFLISGAFISVLYYPPFWYLVGFVLTLHVVVQNKLKQESSIVVPEKTIDNKFMRNKFS